MCTRSLPSLPALLEVAIFYLLFAGRWHESCRADGQILLRRQTLSTYRVCVSARVRMCELVLMDAGQRYELVNYKISGFLPFVYPCSNQCFYSSLLSFLPSRWTFFDDSRTWNAPFTIIQISISHSPYTTIRITALHLMKTTPKHIKRVVMSEKNPFYFQYFTRLIYK